MIKLAVSGACGKMGQRIITLASRDKELQLTCALEHKTHPRIGSLIGEVKVSADVDGIKLSDVLIEFSSPEATITHLQAALRLGRKMVIGTTGLSEDDKAKIETAAKKIAIVLSPNMSIGVNLLFDLVKRTSEKVSGDYQIKIIEAHHIHKKDAPSGTAKKIAQIIEGSAKKVLDIKSIREDEIVGDHRIIFSSAVDNIELSHSAKTRDIFASGALTATKWIVNKNNGLYGMNDVLGLK